jgi:hypothetical protein
VGKRTKADKNEYDRLWRRINPKKVKSYNMQHELRKRCPKLQELFRPGMSDLAKVVMLNEYLRGLGLKR